MKSSRAAAIESFRASQAQDNLPPDASRRTHRTKSYTEIDKEIRGWNVKDITTEFITAQGLFGSGIGASSGLTVEVKGKDLDKLRRLF